MYIDILILGSLRRRAKHGYEIKRNLETLFGGFLTLTNSQLYPALQRFEEMGAVRREIIRQDGKPDRHMYSLTDRGLEVLHAMLCDFPPELARREAEFLTRASYFDLLEPQEQIEILQSRRAMLELRRANLPKMQAHEMQPATALSLRRVLTLRERQIQVEVEWIDALLPQIAREPFPGGGSYP